MWSILKRFIALDRPNQKQCIAATGRALEPVGASQWLLYRDVDEIYRYRRIQQALGLTECQTRMATLPLLATLPENNMAIRYCRLCMEKGFHSSVFQIPWVERCPVHAQKLADQCWACCKPIMARWDRSEEHTSELQSLMRISYAVFCLKKTRNNRTNIIIIKSYQVM